MPRRQPGLVECYARAPNTRGGEHGSSAEWVNYCPLSALGADCERRGYVIGHAILSETLDTLEALGPTPERARVHPDRGYDSEATRERLEARSLTPMISEKGKPAPLQATKRWVVERTNSWHNAHKKLLWCPERRGRVIDFWIAFSEAIIHRKAAHTKSLDSLQLGRSTQPPTITYWRNL